MAKVCLLLQSHWSAAKGGAEYQAHLLATYLTQQGHEVYYIARNISPDSGDYSYRLKSLSSPYFVLSARWGRFWESRRIYSALRDVNPDVVIQRVASAYTGVAAVYCKRNARKLIYCVASDMDVAVDPNVSINGPGRFVDRILYRYGVKNSAEVITQTKHQATLLRRNFRRSESAIVRNFHEVPSGLANKDPQKLIVAWISNFKTIKRPEIFLDLASAHRDNPLIKFVMVGSSGESAWGRSISTRASGMENVCILGERSFDETNRVLESAHILVNTSEYEGFPNTFIQGWMRQVVTLSLNVDPDGIIELHKLGFHARTTDMLATYLTILDSDRSMLAQMGRNARRYAEAHHSMAAAKDFLRLLES